MSTRFYFSQDTAPFSTAAHATWSEALSNPTQRLKLDPLSGTRHTPDYSKVKNVATNPWRGITNQFVSDPLPAAGTLDGTFSMIVLLRESAAALDASFWLVIKVIDNIGTTVRGTAYLSSHTGVSAQKDAINYELNSVAEDKKTRYLRDQTLTPVAYQAGDRIAVEYGAQVNSTSTGTIFSAVSLDREAATDLELWHDILTDPFLNVKHRQWLEFSADLFPITLAAEEFQYLNSGLKLNSSVTLPFFDVTSIDGLDAAPVGLSTTPREGSHGAYAASEFETARIITLEGTAYASPTALEAYLDSLKNNFLPTKRDHPLYFGTDAGMRAVFGKSQGLRYRKSPSRSVGAVECQVQLICQDPRIYYPFERTLGPYAMGISAVVTIGGNRDTPARIVMRGPTTSNPELHMYNSNGYMKLTCQTTLSSDDIVVFDLDARTIIKNFNVNMRESWVLTGDWINLAPAQNYIATGAATGTTATSGIRVHYREAYR